MVNKDGVNMKNKHKKDDYFIRSPIVVVLGHVDSGKTTILDQIRGTAVAKREPGTITQHIGASFLPWSALEKTCSSLKAQIKEKIKIPGLLVIDTPGHEAFSNLRKRGGSIADIAILVIDILRGFQPQTYEAIEILKSRKTPFLAVANKIDRIPGWKSYPKEPFISSFKKQSPTVQMRLEEMIYTLIAEFNNLGFYAERYDRIRDFTKTVAIIPTSAITGEGIPDLLLVLAGLVQKFMLKRLYTPLKRGRGVILEVREEPGLGTTIVVILYEGILRKGDRIVVGTTRKPIVTKIRALLMPKPLDEMRSPEDRFLSMKKVTAAAGVLIVAPNLENVIAGAPVVAVYSDDELEDIIEQVMEEIKAVRIERKNAGIVIKADTLGTLEALVDYVEKNGVPVRYADVGPVSKRDVIEASLSRDVNELYAAILAFNVKVREEAELEAKVRGIKIFQDKIIYKLVESLLEWQEKERERKRKETIKSYILPAKIQILPGYVFRRSNPAIVGIRVLSGRLKKGAPLITEKGKKVGEVMQIRQHDNVLEIAEKGAEVAISIKGKIIVGRQIKEGDILLTDVPLDQINALLTKFKDELSDEEINLLLKMRAEKIKQLSLRTLKKD